MTDSFRGIGPPDRGLEVPTTVLYVDDSEAARPIAESIDRHCETLSVEVVPTPETALERLGEESVGCVVSDYDMPGMDGLELLEAVRETDPELPFVLFTGAGSEGVASEAISAGVSDYVQKGGDDRHALLANRIERLVEGYRNAREADRMHRQFRSLVEESSDVINVLDADGTFRYLSPAVENVLGYDPETLVGEDSFERVHPEDREAVAAEFERLATGETPTAEVEFRFRHADGSWRWLHSRGRDLRDVSAVDWIVVHNRDVTERKEREHELERYRGLVEAAGDAMYVLDDEGYIEMVNDAFCDLSGLSEAEAVGEHVSAFMTEDHVRQGTREILRILEDPDRERGRFEFSGGEFPHDDRVFENIVTVVTDDGRFEGSVGVVRDVTERKEREAELRRQNERLDQFASLVSHDLRNPLEVANAGVELLREDPDGDHVEEIDDALDRMETIIDDLLTLAREGGELEATERVELEPMVEECWSDVGTADADLRAEGAPGIEADPSKLRNLLENLLSNAVEHAGPGATVRVGAVEDGFFVADDGPGIDSGARETVFEAGHSAEGHGFGLFIVREIARAHGWAVSVGDSREGGARFEVTGIEVP